MPKKQDKIIEDLTLYWKECPNCDLPVSVRKGKCRVCGSTYNQETDEWTLVEIKEDKDVKDAKGKKPDDDPLLRFLTSGGKDES